MICLIYCGYPEISLFVQVFYLVPGILAMQEEPFLLLKSGFFMELD